MKQFYTFLFFFVLQVSCFAQIDIKLTINNLRKVEGFLSIEFYRNVENYTRGKNAFKKFYIPIKDIDQYETVIKNVEEKNFYAVKVFVDMNGNKTLDKSFIGIRKEPYGFSGDSHPSLREPTFEEAKFFATKENKNIIINLVNNFNN